MTRFRFDARIFLLCLPMMLNACRSNAQHAAGPAPRIVVLPVPDTTATAYEQFARFLSLAVATRIPRVGALDSVYTCGELEGRQAMRWVAAYDILAVSTHGDSGTATAVVTFVARQTDEGHGWIARQGISTDTVHWRLVRNADTGGRWMSCGDAREQFGILHIGRSVAWLNGSREAALAAVDSIRRARGLEVLR